MSALVQPEPPCWDEVLGWGVLLPVAGGLVCGTCCVYELGLRSFNVWEEERLQKRSGACFCLESGLIRSAARDVTCEQLLPVCLQDGEAAVGMCPTCGWGEQPHLLLVENGRCETGCTGCSKGNW